MHAVGDGGAGEEDVGPLKAVFLGLPINALQINGLRPAAWQNNAILGLPCCATKP